MKLQNISHFSHIKQEPDEETYDECYDDKSLVLSQVPFIDPSVPFEEVACKTEPRVEIEEIDNEKVQLNDVKLNLAEKPAIPLVIQQSTFDGNWSDDDDNESFGGEDFANDDFPDSDDEPLAFLKEEKDKPKKKQKTMQTTPATNNTNNDKSVKQLSRDSFWSHKSKSLAGKIACKYCDTIFETKDEQTAHICKYLQCDRRNFICRICNKELSKKTFSNHLHETLACQYCNKKFVNPRSMKTHILKQHKGKKLVAPRTYKDRREILMAVKQEIEAETGIKRKVYPKKKLRLECGKHFLNSFLVKRFS